MSDLEYVITFKNTNYAIKAEQCLLAEKIHVSVIPLPPAIKEGCGISLRINAKGLNAAELCLKKKEIEYEAFMRIPDGKSFIYKKAQP